jgi:hypothetical protein
MRPFEEKLSKIFGDEKQLQPKYIYPWKRKFEVEIAL